MSSPGLPTLDQLRIFRMVNEEGGFAAAARKLNRAVSAISYGVANLESQLGLELFDRSSPRRPRLTTAGEAMLGEARRITSDVDLMVARARGLIDGLEAELSIVVDVMFPADLLADILRRFADHFPTVALRLHVEALGAIAEKLIAREAAVGICGPLATDFDELDRLCCGSVELVPVCSPGHPLAAAAPLRPGEAREHFQLVLSDRSSLTDGRSFAVQGDRIWRLADLGAKHLMLREGIGWGNMPLPMVADDIKAGRLVKLEGGDIRPVQYDFNIAWRRDYQPGPAGQWFADAIHRLA